MPLESELGLREPRTLISVLDDSDREWTSLGVVVFDGADVDVEVCQMPAKSLTVGQKSLRAPLPVERTTACTSPSSFGVMVNRQNFAGGMMHSSAPSLDRIRARVTTMHEDAAAYFEESEAEGAAAEAKRDAYGDVLAMLDEVS